MSRFHRRILLSSPVFLAWSEDRRMLGLIPNHQDALQRKRKTVAGVQRVEKSTNRLEVLVTAIDLPNCYGEILHFVHHTSLKEILQKLIVDHPSARFNFQY